MSSVRKHTCVDKSPRSAGATVKRGVSLPRRVLSSDSKLKTTGDKATTWRVTSAQHAPKYPAASTLHRPGVPRNMTKKPPDLRLNPLSGGDSGVVKKGSQKVSLDNENTSVKGSDSLQTTDQSPVESSDGLTTKLAVHQIYKNNNFKMQTDCVPNKNVSCIETKLEPITENSENTRTCCSSKSSSAEKCPLLRATRHRMAQEMFDLSDTDKVNDVSTFRKKHFFECHSAEAMLSQRASALRDADHICTYKFYLNERLFPTPLYSDIHNNIRCSDCCLPMSFPSANTKDEIMNATIQAKVTMGSDDQLKDVIISLPANDRLLVMEKNKNVKELLSEDVIHFGILKIDNRKPALVARLVPDNSLALRYQKGYREYMEDDSITLSGVTEPQIVYV